MSLELFTKYVQAVLADDDDAFCKLRMDNFCCNFSDKLSYLAVYCHSHRCLKYLEFSAYTNNAYTCAQISVVADNAVFIENLVKRKGYYMLEGTYDFLHATAVARGSIKVVEFLSPYLNYETAIPCRLYVDNVCSALENIKKECRMIDMWYLNDYHYDNCLQWLPRELVEDQCFLITSDAIEKLYHF